MSANKTCVVKNGAALREGDVIRFWVTGDRGMRICKIMPYTGPFDFVCGVMCLKGARADGEEVTVETVIEKQMQYEVLGVGGSSK